jgi:hypothetical protein
VRKGGSYMVCRGDSFMVLEGGSFMVCKRGLFMVWEVRLWCGREFHSVFVGKSEGKRPLSYMDRLSDNAKIHDNIWIKKAILPARLVTK